jgi:hypothetical protein
MIIRNSLKSVLRTPLKSILFFLLIMSLSTALTLGTALVGMCSALIDECGRSYLTIASLEYRGGRFPDKTVSDPAAAALRSQIDFEALQKLDGVIAVDRSDTAIVSVPRLNRTMSSDSTCKNAVVLTVRKLIGGGDLAKVETALYATVVYEASTIHLVYSGAEEGAELTELEDGHTYLITGFTNGNSAGVITVYVGSVLNLKASEAGIGQSDCILDVTEDKALQNGDPRYQQFLDAAEAYDLINHSWYARITDDPAVLEPFVEKEYSLRDGYIYGAHGTETEIRPAADTVECLLPDLIAVRMGLEPGDEFTLDLTQLGFSSIANSYWPGADAGFSNGSYTELKCTLSGIITTTADEIPLIYLSGLVPGGVSAESGESGGNGGLPDTHEGFCGYTLGTLLLKNGIGEKQLAKLRELLPKDVETAVYDQGYGVVTKAISKLRDNAAGVMTAAVIASAAMIVLFAYVFVGRQSDTLVTMYLMGTDKVRIGLYVSAAAALVLVPSAIAGSILAGAFSGFLSDLIGRAVAQSQTELMSYSSASLGVIKALDPSVSMPLWPQIVCSVCLIAAGLAVCYIFLESALGAVGARPKEIKKAAAEKAKAEKADKAAKKPHTAKPLPFSGAGRKYIVLSLLRGGVRSVAVLLAGILMTVFVLVPATALTSYRRQLKELNENTVITCYFTDYGGKKRYDLVLTENMVGNIVDSEYFTDFHFSLCDNYAVNKVVKAADGGEAPDSEQQTETGLLELPSQGSFSFENFLTNFLNGPKIFYTDKINAAPEFAGRTDAEIQWLDGYDETYFSEERESFEGVRYAGSNFYMFTKDLREFCAVVPDSFLEKYGAELGDSVEMLVSEDLVTETYKIIGVFRSVSTNSFVYTRRDNCHRVISEPVPGSIKSAGVIKARTSFSCGSFLLTNTSDIAEAKRWLRESGYSRVHAASFYRLYPIMEDEEYLGSLEKLERNIGYLEKVLPAISALVLITGFAAAYLLTFRRRVEIATLRSIGETGGRVFAIFAVEQILPALIGACIGAGVWLLVFGAAELVWLALAFIAGFALGTVVSVFRMSRANLLEVLSEKE